MLLHVENIDFAYGKNKPLLKDISFSVEHGDFIGILGPNGCGKTTLLKILSGYLRPDNGHVKIEGKDIQTIPIKELARLRSFVPQESHLEFDYTVEDIVWMGRTPFDGLTGEEAGETKVEEALKACELTHLRLRNARSLSGGEWQRVVLARTLAQDTDIIFLDEPTHFLDIRYQFALLEILKGLNNKGKTIIAVLHDLILARKFCRNVLLLKDGRQQMSGETGQALNVENITTVYGVNEAIARVFSG